MHAVVVVLGDEKENVRLLSHRATSFCLLSQLSRKKSWTRGGLQIMMDHRDEDALPAAMRKAHLHDGDPSFK